MAATGDMVDQETRRVGGGRRVRLPPVGFWSYARQDDYLSQGKLTSLRSLLMFEVQQLYGRGEIRLFQDASTIPHGAAWENEVREALGQSTFFIAIVTPNFIQSEWCCREISLFVEREAELHRLHPDLDRRSRILPIHYIDVTDVDPADPEVLTLLNSLQWFDFRRLRHRDFEGEQVRQSISELAEGIKGLLNLRVEDPETVRAREQAAAKEREQQEQEAAERARQQQEALLKAEADQAEAARTAEKQASAARQLEQQAAAEREAERKREADIVEAEAARKKAEAAAEEARRRAEEAEQAARHQAALAAEAARMLAAEREAAEQARREAAAIAQRLNDAEDAAAAAARLVAERARESAARAQAEQEAAARNQQAAEMLAQQARLESNQAEAHQQALADQVAEQRLVGGGFEPQPGGGNRKLFIAIGAVAVLAVLIYLLWPSQDAGKGVTPVAQSNPATQETSASTDQRAWLTGNWGMAGDCAYLLNISIEGDTMRVRYGGEVQTHRIMTPSPSESWDSLVRTDLATFTRSGDEVEMRERGAVSEMVNRLNRCAGR